MHSQPSLVSILVPELGVGDDPLVVDVWLVNVGESVIAGDRVVSLRTRGIVFDVAAPVAGTLLSQQIFHGQRVSARETLGTIQPETGLEISAD